MSSPPQKKTRYFTQCYASTLHVYLHLHSTIYEIDKILSGKKALPVTASWLWSS